MDDNTPMPFGKYKGMPLGEVPDDYLYWLYNQGNLFGELKEYIEENLDAIKKNINKGRWYNKEE